MDDSGERKEFRLAPGQLLVLGNARGVRIVCLAGCLWVTSQGDCRDHFVLAGEEHRVADSGKVVIEAVKASRLRLAAWKKKPRRAWRGGESPGGAGGEPRFTSVGERGPAGPLE